MTETLTDEVLSAGTTVTTEASTDEVLSTSEVVTTETLTDEVLSTGKTVTTEALTDKVLLSSEMVTTKAQTDKVLLTGERVTTEARTDKVLSRNESVTTQAPTVGLTDITQTSPDRPVTSSKPKTKATVVPIDDIDATDAIIGRFEGVAENTTKESPTKVKTHTFTTEVRCLHSVIRSIVFW